MAACQAVSMLRVLASSRASSLPPGLWLALVVQNAGVRSFVVQNNAGLVLSLSSQLIDVKTFLLKPPMA
jgi:hypothetical protein